MTTIAPAEDPYIDEVRAFHTQASRYLREALQAVWKLQHFAEDKVGSDNLRELKEVVELLQQSRERLHMVFFHDITPQPFDLNSPYQGPWRRWCL